MCKLLFWIEIKEEDSLDPAIEATKEKEIGDKLKIFLNFMVGVTTLQMMRITAKIGKVPLTALIDTGSTHNFLHEPFARLAGLHIESNSSLRVMVANGERLRNLGLCREVTLNLQNSQFLVDFYIIEL